MKQKPNKKPIQPPQILVPGMLAPGDVVRLASGGPLMTVVFVKDSLMPPSPLHGPQSGNCVDARCAWFVTTGPNAWQGPTAGDFSVCLLSLVEARGGSAPQPEERPAPAPEPALVLVQPIEPTVEATEPTG